MSIHFSDAQWAAVRETHRQWWRHELTRPLVVAAVSGAEPDRPPPAFTGNLIEAMYDASIPVEAIVDAWDYQLSALRWTADGFPTVRPNLGPGCNVVWLGARPQVAPTTVWFHPPRPLALAEVELRVDEAHPVLQRLLALYRAAVARWRGHVCVGTADLTPNLDILSVFRPGQELLMDLLDAPERVDALSRQATEVFWQHFALLHRTLQPGNRGYTCWLNVYSEEPYYCLQSDFSYMIGPEQFRRFVLPDLQAQCRRLTHSFYHLDGVGQLPHLDMILGIPELDGVQWIPGAGQPGLDAWPEVHRRIHRAGKLIQISGSLDVLDAVASQLGTTRGLCHLTGTSAEKLPEFTAELRTIGCR